MQDGCLEFCWHFVSSPRGCTRQSEISVVEPYNWKNRRATINGLPQELAGGNVIHSVLDLFILSLLDRGLETPYDLNRQGGLSLGSTVPALRRLESAGPIKRKAPVG